MDYTTIAASIEHARADIRVQIDELRERDTALEQSLTWAAIAYGIDTDANGEPITVEAEAVVEALPPETVTVRKSKPTTEGKRSRLHWPTVFEWVAAAKADGTFSGERLVETFGGNARNWKRECAKLGLTLDTAAKLPKHDFDQQAARDAVAGPPTGPVKPVSVMPLAATPEPKPRDAGYVSVGQVVAAAGDL